MCLPWWSVGRRWPVAEQGQDASKSLPFCDVWQWQAASWWHNNLKSLSVTDHSWGVLIRADQATPRSISWHRWAALSSPISNWYLYQHTPSHSLSRPVQILSHVNVILLSNSGHFEIRILYKPDECTGVINREKHVFSKNVLRISQVFIDIKMWLSGVRSQRWEGGRANLRQKLISLRRQELLSIINTSHYRGAGQIGQIKQNYHINIWITAIKGWDDTDDSWKVVTVGSHVYQCMLCRYVGTEQIL